MSRDNSILSDASDDEDDEDVEFSQDRNKGVTQLKFDLLKGTGGCALSIAQLIGTSLVLLINTLSFLSTVFVCCFCGSDSLELLQYINKPTLCSYDICLNLRCVLTIYK